MKKSNQYRLNMLAEKICLAVLLCCYIFFQAGPVLTVAKDLIDHSFNKKEHLQKDHHHGSHHLHSQLAHYHDHSTNSDGEKDRTETFKFEKNQVTSVNELVSSRVFETLFTPPQSLDLQPNPGFILLPYRPPTFI
jgi:hypothetical protein